MVSTIRECNVSSVVASPAPVGRVSAGRPVTSGRELLVNTTVGCGEGRGGRGCELATSAPGRGMDGPGAQVRGGSVNV